MNNEELESLLEEALHSIQDNIPNMIQSLTQDNNPIFSNLSRHLDISNQSQIRPNINVLQDLSNVNVVTEEEMIEIVSDASSNNIEYHPIQTIPDLSASSATTTSTTNINTNINTDSATTNANSNTTTTTPSLTDTSNVPIYDPEQMHQMALFHFATEYLDNMRLFQQNMGSLIRCLEPSRTRNRMRIPPRTMQRQEQNVPLLTTMTNRLLNLPSNHNPNQVSMEFIATPFSFMNRPQQSVPSLQQYTEATETFTYNSNTVSRINSITCPITLEDFQHGELLCEIKQCHHVFKETALRNWFVRNSHCPVCRYDIRTYVNES